MSERLRIISLSALVVVLVVALWAARSWWVEHDRTELTAKFESAVGLYPGSDVQVLGVSVGEVTDVDPQGSAVRVTMKLDRGVQVDASTDAVIVAPTLVSDRYVQLTEPHTDGTPLASGAVLELDRTAVPVEIDELYRGLEDISTQLGPNGANADGALSELLDVAADNLAGTGLDINHTIRNFSDASATISGIDADLFATISNLAEFTEMLEANDAAVASANRQFAEVTDYLAADRQDLAAAIANLGDAMVVLDEFIAENRGHLTTSVENLIGPTQTLVNQKASLEESVRLIPLVLQNFLGAWNPAYGTLDGRGNLNEATIWNAAMTNGSGLSGQTSPSAPPLLLPGVEEAP